MYANDKGKHPSSNHKNLFFMDRQPDSRTLAWQVNLVISETRSSSHFLLDYGSRYGEFIHLMQNEHWAVKGIEPSDELRAKARRMFALSLLSDEQLTTLDELSYGVVTAWQSLSRNTDTIMLLRQFHKLLVENGSLFISLCPEDFSITEVEQMARQANFGIEKVIPVPVFGLTSFITNIRYRKHPEQAPLIAYHLKKADTLNFRIVYDH